MSLYRAKVYSSANANLYGCDQKLHESRFGMMFTVPRPSTVHPDFDFDKVPRAYNRDT
jgi:hypothetical protein